MPEGFDKCVKGGGRVRTKKLSKGRYVYICYLKGKSYRGEVHKKKGDGLKRSLRRHYGSGS